MKGRLLKKAAALSLAALLVTGGIPAQPIADMAREISVTASAAETVTYYQNGVQKTANAALLNPTDDNRTIQPGWYYTTTADYLIPVTISGTVNLILTDGKSVAFLDKLVLTEGNTLNIYAQSAGTGSLYAFSTTYNDAAIGGGSNQSFGTLNVYGGIVIAENSNSNGPEAAAIGGGCNGSGGTVNIYGGSVTADAGDKGYGAGIGSGANYTNTDNVTGGNISIYGGTVVADGGKIAGAGIGGGYQSSGGNIIIYGGTVTATGGYTNQVFGGAGIGGGTARGCESIAISGGVVNAYGGNAAAAIGCGNGYFGDPSCANITISGGQVTAVASSYSSFYGKGVGGGHNGTCNSISLGWSNADDFLNLGSVNGTVQFTKDFVYENNLTSPVTAGNADWSKKLVPAYSIGTNVTHCTINVPSAAGAGATVNMTVTPDSSYDVQSVTAGSTAVTKIDDTHYSFVMPSSNVTVSAVCVQKYTVTWKNADGTTLETDTNVSYGATPSYDGAIPTKASDDKYSYNFKAWTPSISTVTGDVTYTATYTKTPNPAHFSQSGDTYRIHTATGWDIFCDCLNDNDKGYFDSKTVKLDADIEVIRMAGSSHHDFTGTFDGQGHTLTFNYGTSTAYADDEYTAPFRFVESGCRIENLHVDGDIYTTAKYATGLIGSQYGAIEIKNCRVSTVIHSDINGDGTHAGFVATNANTAGSSITIEGCAFDGKILTTGTNDTGNCAGFVGWKNKTVNITNSIYAPAAIADGEKEVVEGTGDYPSSTFVRNGGAATITNCYYTRTLNTNIEQGKAARTITADQDVNVALYGDETEYTVSGITAYENNSGLKYGDVIYAGKDDSVTLTLGHDTQTGYSTAFTASNGGTITGTANPYTLTMPDSNVVISAADTQNDYTITASAEHGAVTVTVGETQNAATAHYGETVTLTVTTDTGYELKSLTVKDADDNDVTVTENNNGTYFFDMPASNVTVTADIDVESYFDSTTGTLTLKGTLLKEQDYFGIGSIILPKGVSKTDVLHIDVDEAGATFPQNSSYLFKDFNNVQSVDLTNSNTGNVTNTSCMFYYCEALTTLTFGSTFDTSSVTDMHNMFLECKELKTLDLSGFNTSSVMEMYCMFANCYALTSLDLSGFDTSNVIDMHSMFDCCNSLTTLDLSSFDTSNVDMMIGMFEMDETNSLTTIYVGKKWTTANVRDSDYMFTNCTHLTGGNGTIFDNSKIDKTYAVIDKQGQPGYLTGKYFDVTITSGGHGTVTAEADSFLVDDTVTLTVAPDTGCKLKTLTVKDANNNEIEVTNYQFIMPASDVTVTAEFEQNDYSITISAGANGTVSAKIGDDPAATAHYNDTVTLTVTPNEGYTVKSVTVNGTAIESVEGVYSFAMPAEDVTVTAKFEKPPVSVNYIDENGTEQTVDAIPLDNTMTTLEAGIYVVNSDVTYNSTVTLGGDVTLILCDSKTMSITINDDGYCIEGGENNTAVCDFTVYGQSEQTGALTANGGILGFVVKDFGIHGGNITCNNNYGINTLNTYMDNGKVNGDIISGALLNISGGEFGNGVLYSTAYIDQSGSINISGGIVNAIGGSGSFLPIAISGDHISITGGQVTAIGQTYGISSGHEINLGFTGATDFVQASSFSTMNGKSIEIQDGLTYTDGTNFYSGTLTYERYEEIAGKKLVRYDGYGARLEGYSLSIQNDGDIGVNFYMLLDDSIVNNANAKMRFVLPVHSNENLTRTLNIPIGEAVTANIGEKTYYVFKCPVAAKEMTAAITAQVYVGDEAKGDPYTYTVRDYAEYLINHAEGNEAYTKALPLVKAMLHYGASAQTLFNNIPGDLANKNIEAAAYDDPTQAIKDMIDGTTLTNLNEASVGENLTFDGASLNLGSKTAYTLYYAKGENYSGEAPTITCEGHDVDVVENANEIRYIIRNISAGDLLKNITVTIGITELTVNPATYFYAALTAQNTNEYDYDNLKKAVTALYYFNEAAKNYKGVQ